MNILRPLGAVLLSFFKVLLWLAQLVTGGMGIFLGTESWWAWCLRMVFNGFDIGVWLKTGACLAILLPLTYQYLPTLRHSASTSPAVAPMQPSERFPVIQPDFPVFDPDVIFNLAVDVLQDDFAGRRRRLHETFDNKRRHLGDREKREKAKAEEASKLQWLEKSERARLRYINEARAEMTAINAAIGELATRITQEQSDLVQLLEEMARQPAGTGGWLSSRLWSEAFGARQCSGGSTQPWASWRRPSRGARSSSESQKQPKIRVWRPTGSFLVTGKPWSCAAGETTMQPGRDRRGRRS